MRSKKRGKRREGERQEKKGEQRREESKKERREEKKRERREEKERRRNVVLVPPHLLLSFLESTRRVCKVGECFLAKCFFSFCPTIQKFVYIFINMFNYP